MKLDYCRNIKRYNKLVFIGRFNPAVNKLAGKHYHPFHELLVITKGALNIEISKKIITVNPGDILSYSAGVNHEEQLAGNDPLEFISFAWYGEKKIKFPVVTHDINKRITYLAQWAYETNQSSSSSKRLLQDNIFELIMTELSEISKFKEKHPIVSKIRSFMMDNLKKNLTVEDLASHVDMSKWHFFKKYKKLTGQSPMKELRIIRAEKAKDMILTTALPLKTISKEVGFADVYHLSKIFRKYFGIPPGHFRDKTVSL
ncbi:MAG: AraC family transcriptional regulator [Elusimicrobia bacterium]|nr:AraC family transcriptional regulator [Elusimicrobiota bacterium]